MGEKGGLSWVFWGKNCEIPKLFSSAHKIIFLRKITKSEVGRLQFSEKETRSYFKYALMLPPKELCRHGHHACHGAWGWEGRFGGWGGVGWQWCLLN